MAEPFDALYQWLGIPPAEQPPHHYRLLGIQLFETSADVISHAADRQMTHVRTFQTGPRAALSQQILNQISTARVCLLDAVRKAAYDEKLRAQLAPRPEPVVVPSFPAKRPPRRKGRKWALPVVLVGSLLITIVVAGLVYRNAQREDETAAARSQQQQNPDGPEKSAAEPSPRPQPRETTEPAEQDGPPSEPSADNADNQPPELEQPDIEPPAEPPPPTPLPETTQSAEAAPKKLTVPDEASRLQALRDVRDLFKDKYASAKTREDKVSLAELLLEQADGLKDDSEARFVVLDEARKLAVDAGNQELALRAVRDVIEFYAVDELAWKTQLLLDTAPAARTADLKREHSTHALDLTDEAVEAERFEVAEKLVRLAKKLLQRSGDVELRKRALAVGKEVKTLQRQWARIIAARKTLAENPDDPAANLVVGKYLCLQKDDWPQGLPLLAKSSVPKLQAAAQQDLTNPTDPAAQTKAGDTWYDLSQSDKTHQAFSIRAHHWYTLALPKAKGLTKAKLAMRLDELSDVAATKEGTRTENFDVDPGWTKIGSGSNRNNFGYQPSSSHAGGSKGEAGGRFTRSGFKRVYADTKLGGVLTLDNKLHASGKFDFTAFRTPDFGQPMSLGHFNVDAADTFTSNKIGLRFNNGAADSTKLAWGIWLRLSNGAYVHTPQMSIDPNIDHTWEYDWDPNGGVHGAGRLTASLSDPGGGTQFIDLNAAQRKVGAKFNAFGLNGGFPTPPDSKPSEFADMFIDDVIYTIPKLLRGLSNTHRRKSPQREGP